MHHVHINEAFTGLAQGSRVVMSGGFHLAHIHRVSGNTDVHIQSDILKWICLKGRFYASHLVYLIWARVQTPRERSAIVGPRHMAQSEWASGRLHTSASGRKAEVAPRSAFHVSINPKIDCTQRQLQRLFKHWRATYPWKNVEEEQKQVLWNEENGGEHI